MKIRKIASVFSIFMGISMIGMWSMFYFTGGIPELEIKPVEIIMHITAELLTAIMLIIGGTAVLLKKSQGLRIYFVSMGMLLYTLVVSPGYYIQRGEIAFIAMFAVFFILSVLSLILMFSGKHSPIEKERL